MNKKQLEPTNSKKFRRPAVVSSMKIPPRDPKTRPNLNATFSGEYSMLIDSEEEDYELKSLHQQFLRNLLADCLVDMKIKREETEVDIQMTQLADRFSKTVDQLEKTRKRLKDISFVTEQKRLLDLKTQDCLRFEEITETSGATDMLNKLATCEHAYLDKLVTKNVDFGYNKESGHKQLLDAVNDAIDGLEQIKKDSGLDTDKLKQFEVTQTMLDEIEKKKFDMERTREKLEKKLPDMCEKLLWDFSEKADTMLKID